MPTIRPWIGYQFKDYTPFANDRNYLDFAAGREAIESAGDNLALWQRALLGHLVAWRKSDGSPRYEIEPVQAIELVEQLKSEADAVNIFRKYER